MDHARGLGGLVALVDGPGAAFVSAGREEGLQAEQVVGALDEADHAGFLQAHFFEEHLPVFVVLHLGDLGLGAGGDHEDLGLLVLDGLAHSVHVGVSVDYGSVVHVADIEHGLVGQQEEVVGQGHFVFVQQGDAATGVSLLQGGLVAEEQRQQFLGLFVPAGRGLLLDLGDPGVDGF